MMEMKKIQQHLFTPDYNSTSGPSGEDIPRWQWTGDKRTGQKLLKHLSLKVIVLIRESSLQIRRHGTSIPEFILRQRLQNSRFHIVKQERKTSLLPEREVLITQWIAKLRSCRSLHEEREIADYENEDQAIRERARERINENQERIDAFGN